MKQLTQYYWYHRRNRGNRHLALIRATVIQHCLFYSAVIERETRFASGMEPLSDLSRSIRHQDIFEPQRGNFGWIDCAQNVDCSQSPIFPWDHRRRSLSPTGPLDASETGESTKYQWVGVVEGTAGEKNFNPISLTHGHFVLSSVSLASRDQDGGPSDSTIDIYDLTEK